MATIYYDKDANRDLLKKRKVAVIGYGSQGHAHALNLKDSGVDVRVGLAAGSKSKAKAEGAGLKVLTVAEASKEADVIMMLTPDQTTKAIYDAEVCRDENRAFFKCVAGATFTCDVDGESQFAGCEDEFAAFLSCNG